MDEEDVVVIEEEVFVEEVVVEEEVFVEVEIVSVEVVEGEEEEFFDDEKKMSQIGEICICWVDYINKEIKVEVVEVDREKWEKECKECEEEECCCMIE